MVTPCFLLGGAVGIAVFEGRSGFLASSEL